MGEAITARAELSGSGSERILRKHFKQTIMITPIQGQTSFSRKE